MSRQGDGQQPGETAAGTVMAGVFRLLRGILRGGDRHGGRAVVTGATTGPGKAIRAHYALSTLISDAHCSWPRNGAGARTGLTRPFAAREGPHRRERAMGAGQTMGSYCYSFGGTVGCSPTSTTPQVSQARTITRPLRTRTLPAVRRPPSRQYMHGSIGTRSRSRTGRNDGRSITASSSSLRNCISARIARHPGSSSVAGARCAGLLWRRVGVKRRIGTYPALVLAPQRLRHATTPRHPSVQRGCASA